MRRRDFSGEKAWSGALVSIRERTSARVEGVKMSAERRFVMRSVFVGGEGVIRGGRVLRSSWSGVLSAGDVEGDAFAEVGGETVVSAMAVRVE